MFFCVDEEEGVWLFCLCVALVAEPEIQGKTK